MRIVIDMQACQSTGSRDRGIGRYSLALTKAMLANAGQHEMHLLFNGLFSDTVEPLINAFSEFLPMSQMHVWHAPAPVSAYFKKNEWRCRSAELMREQTLANLRPDFVHVTSLFEGSGDDAVTSISSNGEHLATAVTLYDLIPFVYEDKYLNDERQKVWYYRKLGSLKQADLLLAISDSSRREAIAYLGLDAKKIVNISSAVEPHFVPLRGDDVGFAAIKLKFSLDRQFVMYTGGLDLRKNIDALVLAFADLPSQIRKRYQLAIVCAISPNESARLKKLAISAGMAQGDLVLTGFVSDVELTALYQHCALFVFPSWHEGFGLPALEAMSCGAAVIAANTSSLPEVLGRSDALFDPFDQQSITKKIVDVLSNESFHASLTAHSLVQAKKFSWSASGKTAMAAIENQHESHKLTVPTKFDADFLPSQMKPRMAYFSPLLPARSGVAFFSSELLPELQKYYDIELITESENIDDPWLRANFNIRSVEWFHKNAYHYDRVVYNFGNSQFHAFMLNALSVHPGVVILHDFFLSGLLLNVQQSNRDSSVFFDAMYESHGFLSLLLTQRSNDIDGATWKYPCNFGVLKNARGVISHSQYAIDLAKKWYGKQFAEAWKSIRHLHRVPIEVSRKQAREKLGLAENDFIVCSFGLLGSTKMNIQLLKAWNEAPLAADMHCRLVFVGEADKSLYCTEFLHLLARTIKDLGAPRVSVTGFVDEHIYSQYLCAADIAVQLRGRSRGEASYTVLDCLSHGLPVILNRHGAMQEFPANCVFELQDGFTSEDMVAALMALKNSSQKRQELSQFGREYVKRSHSPEIIAADYWKTIEHFVSTEPANKMQRTTTKLAALADQAAVQETELVELATCLAANQCGLGRPQILVDISEFNAAASSRSLTEKEQILRSFLIAFIETTPSPYRVEPVNIDQKDGQRIFRYARQNTCELLGLPRLSWADDVVDVNLNDQIVYVGFRQRVGIESQQTDALNFRYLRRHYIDLATFHDGHEKKWNDMSRQTSVDLWGKLLS